MKMRRRNMDRLNLAQAIGVLALFGAGGVAILGFVLLAVDTVRRMLS